MDAPITDVQFVCSPDKAPKGYKVITECPCGHDAQLWEKVLGGESATRYICFSKEDQGDDKVIVDMYVPGPSQQYLKQEYKIIADTIEGHEPLRHKQLAVKKGLRSEVTDVVVDIIVMRSKDSVSKMYTRMLKVNGLRIAFRKAKYNPDSTSQLLKEYNPSTSIGPPSTKAPPPNKAPPPAVSPKHVDPSSYSPSPSFKSPSVSEEAVQVKTVDLLVSAPPPSQDVPLQTQHVPPIEKPVAFPVSFDTDEPATLFLPPPSTVPTFAPPSHQYPSPQQPSSFGGVSATPTYHQPQHSQPALSPGGGAPGYYPPAPTQPLGYNSAQAPPTNTGYDMSIGFSLGGNDSLISSGSQAPPPFNSYQQHQQPRAPPPFDPYQQQQQHQQQPGAPPQAPPNQTNYNTNIGFNF